MSLIDNIGLRELLPHRYPLLLVDYVEELELYKSIKAIKNVTCKEPFFEGHFPDYPVMPGVLIIEALAQAAGVLTLKSEESSGTKRSLFFLAGIDNARFKRPVVPGDRLELHAEMIRHKLNLWKFKCTATIDGEMVCSADIMNMKAVV